MGADVREYDLAVIGAGINGAGIARDAAMRGLAVAVFDHADICSGTSAASSRLIHGGLRYLEYGELSLVYESLHERRYLRRIAGHLVEPLRICIPIYEGAKRGPLLIRMGMIAYDLLSWGKELPRHEMLGHRAIAEAEPGLRQDSLRAAARYYDGQVNFAERLVLENLLAARAAGADIHTYTGVTGLVTDRGRVTALRIEDKLTRERSEVPARMVVNASGPWVDSVLTSSHLPFKRFIGGTKGSHIVVSPFPGAPTDAFYVEAESDGRPFFIIPWNGLYLIGTTDIRYEGDPAKVRASRAEVDYLLNETNRVFPNAGLSLDRVHYAYAGIRPLPHRTKGPESAITRKHIIKSHRRIVRGLFSIIGGKLTTYRSLAEQAVDKVGKALGRKLPPCRTHDTLLPGAWGLDAAREALESWRELSEAGVERLLGVYGGRAAGIAELARRRPELAACIDEHHAIPAAEIAFVVAEEMCRTLIDIVHRRTMIGLAANQGVPLYDAVAAIAAQEFGWDDERAAAEVRALHEFSGSLRVG
jgi:glycerol-3-phosphate dehydrogenase